MAGKRTNNKCLVFIPNLGWRVQGNGVWVAKPAREACSILGWQPPRAWLSPHQGHLRSAGTPGAPGKNGLFPLGSVWVGFTIVIPLVRAVVGTAVCLCVGGVPIREDATTMLGLGTGSLTGAAGIKPTSRDISACVILGLGESP